jgi:hypothetical protein
MLSKHFAEQTARDGEIPFAGTLDPSALDGSR